METIENDGGGKSVMLAAGDSLEKVPKSHRDLITPRIREVLEDPAAYFGEVAARTPFRNMAKWLRALMKENNWELALHQGDPKEHRAARFAFYSEKVRWAEITPAAERVPASLPPTLREYYSLVDEVSWSGFGCSGGLAGCTGHPPLSVFGFEVRGARIDPQQAFVFGWSFCGDMLIYATKDRGGWCCHENGKVHLLGSIGDTINWVYGELLANRTPEFNYEWE
jgi:hypothetical protein